MFKKFKEFAFKGNVFDMAIGVVMGNAFGKIISSLVSDVIMPFFGFMTAEVKFDSLKIVLSKATDTTEEVAIKYGVFIENIIDFFIIAVSIFLFVSIITKARKKLEINKEEQNGPKKPTVDELLVSIRDILKQQNEKNATDDGQAEENDHNEKEQKA